jgi:hypothetical protein
MKRITVLHYTGADGTNLKVARRIARKMLAAQRQGICVLLDFEDVDVSSEFLAILVSSARAEMARFCGLPILQQHQVVRLQNKGRS